MLIRMSNRNMKAIFPILILLSIFYCYCVETTSLNKTNENVFQHEKSTTQTTTKKSFISSLFKFVPKQTGINYVTDNEKLSSIQANWVSMIDSWAKNFVSQNRPIVLELLKEANVS